MACYPVRPARSYPRRMRAQAAVSEAFPAGLWHSQILASTDSANAVDCTTKAERLREQADLAMMLQRQSFQMLRSQTKNN